MNLVRKSNDSVKINPDTNSNPPLSKIPYLKNEYIDVDKSPSTSIYKPFLESSLYGDEFRCETPTEPRTDHYLTHYVGGSLVELQSVKVDPFKDGYCKDVVRGVKKPITSFSVKSRRNMLEHLAKIDQTKLSPKSIQFLTLTIDGLKSPTECKKYLNNFLTQLRQKITHKRWFYIWKQEPHKKLRDGKVQMHYHLVLMNIKKKHIDHKWVRHTWSRITLGYKEYKKRLDSSSNQKEVFKSLVITDIQNAKSWGNTQRYFSKILAYVSKNGKEEQELIKKSIKGGQSKNGRWWGIGKKDAYLYYVNQKIFNLTDVEMSKLRRVFRKCIKSVWFRKYKDKFNWSKWKMYEKYLTSGRMQVRFTDGTMGFFRENPKQRLFMEDRTMVKLLKCLFPNKNLWMSFSGIHQDDSGKDNYIYHSNKEGMKVWGKYVEEQKLQMKFTDWVKEKESKCSPLKDMNMEDTITIGSSLKYMNLEDTITI